MARSEELNARLIREMHERARLEQERRRERQQRLQSPEQQLDEPSQEQTRQQLEQDQQAERQDDDLRSDDPSYDDPALGGEVEYDDYDYDEVGGGGTAPVVAGDEQTWAAPTAESRREGRPGPSEPAGRQHDPDAGPDRRPGERPDRAPGAGPDGRPGQDAPGQNGPTRQSGDRATQHTGRDTGGRRPGEGPQRPGGPNSGPGRGAGPGAGRGPGAGAGAGTQNRPGPVGPPSQQQLQRPGQGKKRLGAVVRGVGDAMDPTNVVEGGAVGQGGSQSFGVADAAADVAKVLNATKSARTIPRPQVGTAATPHAGSTAGGHHRAHGHGGRSQDRGESQDFERARAGR